MTFVSQNGFTPRYLGIQLYYKEHSGSREVNRIL